MGQHKDLSIWSVITALFLALLATALPLSVSKVEASPATTDVPDDYTTIQAAVDAAGDRNTVVIHPGTYNESGCVVHRRQ